MNAVTKTYPGHWADSGRDLMEGDRRVSLAEQQDYLPARPKRKWLDSIWFVVLLSLSGLVAPFIGSLIAIWK